jgi:hypothetical protein
MAAWRGKIILSDYPTKEKPKRKKKSLKFSPHTKRWQRGAVK